MATVEVTFTPLPAHVRTARLVATAVARRSGVDESLLDEVRLAVGEACSRAVEAHRQHCPRKPIRVELTDHEERFEVVVTDAAPAGENGAASLTEPHAAAKPQAAVEPQAAAEPHAAAEPQLPADLQLPAGVGLAVIAGLADDVRISPAGAGISVRMSWKHRTSPDTGLRLPHACRGSKGNVYHLLRNDSMSRMLETALYLGFGAGMRRLPARLLPGEAATRCCQPSAADQRGRARSCRLPGRP
jgi:serine/threonine-protein kinase RsbW